MTNLNLIKGEKFINKEFILLPLIDVEDVNAKRRIKSTFDFLIAGAIFRFLATGATSTVLYHGILNLI